MKLYIVDDDPIHVMLLRKAITNVNPSIEITDFPDGQMALDHLVDLGQAKNKPPHIILLDLNMPVLDGWEFLNEYLTLPAAIKEEIALYVVSSSISPTDVARAMQYDVVSDFLIKPLDPQKIADILNHAI